MDVTLASVELSVRSGPRRSLSRLNPTRIPFLVFGPFLLLNSALVESWITLPVRTKYLCVYFTYLQWRSALTSENMYHDQASYHPQNGQSVHIGDHEILHHPNGHAYHPHAHAHSQTPNREERVENTVPESNGGPIEEAPAKKKRKKVSHACLYCRRSHMVCDEGRPCQRWCV